MSEQNTIVIIKARNEEKFIGKTLESLMNQDLIPYRIIVVDDGSTDKTSEIASSFDNVEILYRENTGDHRGTKEITKTVNTGLSLLDNEKNCDFIMILDSDIILPINYVSTMTSRMINNPKLAISSGIIEGEYSTEPRGGGGRLVTFKFWSKIGLRYPENFAYEGYLLFKAESMGYEVKVFTDIVMKTQRKTESTYNPKIYLNFGKGYKALGYIFPFVLFKSFLATRKSIYASYYLLKGYFSKYDDIYEKELRDFVKAKQYNKLRRLSLKDIIHIFRIFSEK